MHRTSCLEFRGNTRTMPEMRPVKRRLACSATSRHLTSLEVSRVSCSSPAVTGRRLHQEWIIGMLAPQFSQFFQYLYYS